MSGKKLSLIVAAFSSICGSAWADQATTNFSVTATVVATCGVTATDLAFGTYTSSANLDETSTVSVTCTSGTGYSVALNTGGHASGSTRRMSNGASSHLTYELYSDGGRSIVWNAATPVTGTGSGSAQTLTVHGRIPSGQNVPAGSYTDTVQVTVTY